MQVLVLTTLYPNQIQFRHGIFIETRMRELAKTGSVELTVIAPVPWFPVKSTWFPEYSRFVDVPRQETRHGICIYHPRYLVIPKIGMLITPLFLALSFYRQAKQLQQSGQQFDVLDAHYYYPDGVAAALVAKWLQLPLTISARGSDINLIANFSWPRRMMVWASRIARFNIAVCQALQQRMIAIGVDAKTTRVLRNGVDLSLFQPLARETLRQQWQLQGRVLLSVGNLIELKGHHLIIEALQTLSDYTLLIVGAGDWADKLKTLTQRYGLEQRVRFLGEMQQQQLPELYNCADALILASSREGWANVLLEAMACGTPVVATDVGGAQEIVKASEAGVLCKERSANGIAEAVTQLFAAYPERRETRRYAEQFSWDETSQGLNALFADIKL